MAALPFQVHANYGIDFVKCLKILLLALYIYLLNCSTLCKSEIHSQSKHCSKTFYLLIKVLWYIMLWSAKIILVHQKWEISFLCHKIGYFSILLLVKIIAYNLICFRFCTSLFLFSWMPSLYIFLSLTFCFCKSRKRDSYMGSNGEKFIKNSIKERWKF